MSFFKKLILEREEEREREADVRNINQLPPVRALTGDQAHNLSVCSDLGLNLQTFGVWGDAPTDGATQPGLMFQFTRQPRTGS